MILLDENCELVDSGGGFTPFSVRYHGSTWEVNKNTPIFHYSFISFEDSLYSFRRTEILEVTEYRVSHARTTRDGTFRIRIKKLNGGNRKNSIEFAMLKNAAGVYIFPKEKNIYLDEKDAFFMLEKDITIELRKVKDMQDYILAHKARNNLRCPL